MLYCAQIDFPGTMYITDKHTCFSAFSGSVSFSLPHKAKQTVKKMLQGVGSGALLTSFCASAMQCGSKWIPALKCRCQLKGSLAISQAPRLIVMHG